MAKIRGMTIEIGADTTKFDKVINKTRTQLNKLNKGVTEINSLLKRAPNDQDLYAQSFVLLNKQLEVSKERLAELNKAYNILEKDFKDGKVGQDELLALQREIKATELNIKRFEGSMKSMEKRSSVFAELSAKVKILDGNIKKTKDSLKKVDEALKLDPKNVDLITEKQYLLSKTIKQTQERLDLVKRAQHEAIKEFNKGNLAREEYSKICAEVVKTTEELKKLTLEANNSYKKLNEMGDKVGSFGDKANQLGNSLTMKVTTPIAGMFTMATKEAMNLETAMAGVRKTTDMTDVELEQMKNTFVAMSKEGPVAAKELANIGEMAGQLGIKKENIADFAKTISDLTIATNLTSEQASMDLSRFINITQMSQDEVGNLGSAIVELGNNYATSETEIVGMGLRLAAQGKIIGLTEAQTMGLATALSSVGLKSEQGGSAMSRILLKMNTAVLSTKEKVELLNKSLEGTGYTINDVTKAISMGGKDGKQRLEQIAEAIGMTADDLKDLTSSGEEAAQKLEVLGQVSGLGAEGFAKAWREDPMKAITAFIDGIHTMAEKNEDLNTIFEALGVNGIREVDVLQRLSGANTELKEAVDTASKAYEENTALAQEVAIFADTNEAKLKKLKNNFIELGLKVADVLLPIMEDLVAKLMEIIDSVSKMDPKTVKAWVKALLGLAALGPIIKIVGLLSKGLGGLLKLSGDVAGNMGVLKEGFDLANIGTSSLSKGISTLAFKLGPEGALIAGISGVVIYGLKKLNDHMKQSAVESDIFGEEVSEGTKKAVGGFLDLNNEATISLNELKANGDILSQETVTTIADHFNGLGGKIASKIDERKTEAVNSIRKMYEDMGAETDVHQLEVIAGVEITYEEMKRRTEEGQARIIEILEKAKADKRVLSEEERLEIQGIQNQMKEDGIRILSETEEEYAIIRQRMKDQASAISAEQAAQLVKSSVETKDNTIAAAEEEYNERIRVAEELRAQGTQKSNELADEIIKNAKKVRDETIKDAEERHRKIVEEAKGQAKEHVNEVNWETGEILSKWEVFHKNLGTGWDNFWKDVDRGAEKFGQDINRAFSNTWRDIKKGFDSWKNDMSTRFSRLNENARKNIDNIVESFKKMPGKIKNGIITKWNEVTGRIHDAFVRPFKNIVEAIKRTFNFTLPRPKLPHININWRNVGMGISIPNFGIEWYKKGAIFTKPTMFNTPFGMKGVGEAGPEAVLPIEKLSDIFVDTMTKLEGNTGGDIYISGNEFIVRDDNDIEKIARELQKMIDRKRRGVGL